MKNKILYLTRNTIPYVKELYPLAGSVSGCLLMQQLDYWFERREEGYYKFLEPVDHEKYQPGGSWTEELGFSKDEFRTAFDKIGVRYNSKTQYLAMVSKGDPFQGKYYCSYFDNKMHCTWYFRNHDLLDAALDALISNDNNRIKKTKKQGRSDQESQSAANRESQSAANRESQSAANRESQSALYKETEITLQRLHTTEVTNTTARDFESSNSELLAKPENRVCVDLIFPSVSEQTRSALERIIANCNPADGQAILDEISGTLVKGTCKNPITLAMSLVKALTQGTFYPSLGVTVAQNRQNRAKSEELARVVAATQKPENLDPLACQKGQEIISTIRTRRRRKEIPVDGGMKAPGVHAFN